MRAKKHPSLTQILCLAAAISIGPFLPAALAQAPADLGRDENTNITDRDVVLNIGYKSDGLVALSEFRDLEGI